jgi:hypothetical protein
MRICSAVSPGSKLGSVSGTALRVTPGASSALVKYLSFSSVYTSTFSSCASPTLRPIAFASVAIRWFRIA